MYRMKRLYIKDRDGLLSRMIIFRLNRGSRTKNYSKSLFSLVPQNLSTDSDFDHVLCVFYSDRVEHHDLHFFMIFLFVSVSTLIRFPCVLGSLPRGLPVSILLNSLFYLFRRDLILGSCFIYRYSGLTILIY